MTADDVQAKLLRALTAQEQSAGNLDTCAHATKLVESLSLASIALELREMRKLMADNAFVNGPGLFAQSNRAQ